MEHYLDNSATTMPCAAAQKAMISAAAVWGNPSSVHSHGQRAASLLKESRAKVARALGLPRFSKDMLVFTSCGTEANNIAMLGCARSKNRTLSGQGYLGTVIITAGEHPSVDSPAALLEKEGYAVIRIPTTGGEIDLAALEKALTDAPAPVIFAAFMLVNNETGAIYDVKRASAMVKGKFPDATVHCDAVQGFMKLRFTPASLGVDTLTVSAHKIHAPRGAAALFISAETIKRKNIVAVMPGGGQESGFRSGTENLISIAAFASAAEDGAAHFDENCEKVRALREYLDSQLTEKCPEIRYNRPKNCIPNICSIILPSIKSETMLNHLSARGVYVSAGSACSAYSKKKSGALEAFGTPTADADSTLRISLSHMNDKGDIDALVEGLREGIASLQRKR